MNDDDFFGRLQNLVESWCDRRCYFALRHVLKGYPMSSSLSDDWHQLLNALEEVRAFAKDELSDTERVSLEKLIREIHLR